MFAAVVLMCLAPKRSVISACRTRVEIPEADFLYWANRPFTCRGCGHHSDQVAPYLRQVLRLRQACRALLDEGLDLTVYELGCDVDEDGPSIVPIAAREQDDWGLWNLQIASIWIAPTDDSARKAHLWHEAFWLARDEVAPGVTAQTFRDVLRRRAVLFSDGTEQCDLHALPGLIGGIHRYNQRWLDLVESEVTAAPIGAEPQPVTL